MITLSAKQHTSRSAVELYAGELRRNLPPTHDEFVGVDGRAGRAPRSIESTARILKDLESTKNRNQ